jgi:hypothetical protein
MNAATLHRLDGVGDLYELARRDFGIGERTKFNEFHARLRVSQSGVRKGPNVHGGYTLAQLWRKVRNAAEDGTIVTAYLGASHATAR